MTEVHLRKAKDLPPIVPGLTAALKQGLTPDLFLSSECVSPAHFNVVPTFERFVEVPPALSSINYSDPFEARYCRRRKNGALDAIEVAIVERIKSSKLMIVKGESGIGKTTVLRYCIRKLHEEQLKSDPRQEHTVLWLDLKLATGFDKEVFYDMLWRRIKESFPSFPFDPDMWDDYLNSRLTPDARHKRRRSDNNEAENYEMQQIYQAASDHQLCVVEFVKYRKKKNPDGLILLVADNIDTALVKMPPISNNVEEVRYEGESSPRETAWQRVLIQTVLGDTVSTAQALYNLIDTTIIATRLETYAKFEQNLQIQVSQRNDFVVEAVDPYFGIKGRIDYVKACVECWELNSQHFHEVGIYGFKSDWNKGLPHATRRVGFQFPFERFPDFYKIIPDSFSDTFLVFNARSYKNSLADFTSVGNLVQAALSEQKPNDSQSASSLLLGARSNVAWNIFRLLCGESMRKAVELSGVVLESPGIYHQAVHERGLRAYAFLDSLVDSAFNGSSSGVGSNSEKYIGNVFYTELSTTDALLFIPALISDLVSKRLKELPDAKVFRSKSIDYLELVSRFISFGFARSVVEEGLKRASILGFLRPIANANGDLIAFSIDDALLNAHDLLIYEAAYLDNVLFSLKDLINAFSTVRRTVGYNPLDLPDRIMNSQKFIELLISSEIAFSKRLANNSLMLWKEVGVKSVAIRALARYNDRLKAISKRMPDAVLQRVNTFRTHFETNLNLSSLDSLDDSMPLFPFDGKFS